jgi:hypothetical protein
MQNSMNNSTNHMMMLERLYRTAKFLCLAVTFLAGITAGPARAEDTEPVRPEPDAEQGDLYYDAMLKSIELDKNRWRSFSRSMEGGPWFYDTQGLKRGNGTVTVPVTVYPHPNRTEVYRSVYPEHAKIRKIVFVTEINCSGKTYRQPRISVHGYFNELLVEHIRAGRQLRFSPIKPGTTTDTLRNLVCGSGRKMAD